MFEFTFLGTGAMKPTPRRFTSSVLIRFNGEVVMFDAGEGIQVRLAQSEFSLMKIDKIFITHFHGDHFYGLPGIIFSMAKSERTKPLDIYGPRESKKFVEQILNLGYGHVPFEVRVHELEAGSQIKGNKYTITAFATSHGPPSLGYLFKEDDDFIINKKLMEKNGLKPNPKFKLLKQGQTIQIGDLVLKPRDWLIPIKGDSLAYTGDTRPTESVAEAVEGASVLIHEATYLDGDVQEDRGHSTAKGAAEIAKSAGVKFLFLIHISPRYGPAKNLLDQAKEVFTNTYLPRDLSSFRIKRGVLEAIK